jgi:ATP-dependent RNA helicase RhlE
MSFIKPKEQPTVDNSAPNAAQTPTATNPSPANQTPNKTPPPATPTTKPKGSFVTPTVAQTSASNTPKNEGTAASSSPKKVPIITPSPQNSNSTPQNNAPMIPAISVEPVAPSAPPVEWDTLGLSPETIKILTDAGMKNPTPVQAKSIPEVLDNYDLIASAQTGTGKTAAFVLPIVEKIKGRSGTLCVVLCPTREIALQSQKVFEQFGKPFGIEAVSLIGGTPLRADEALLKTYPQVIIATPGRLCDHIERGTIWLDYLEILVLDEADRMLDMGFSTQLNKVIEQTPNNRQTLLFSATLSPTIEKLSKAILYEPVRIEIGRASRTANTIEQRFVFLAEDDKFIELEHLLYEVQGPTFVFARSKESAAGLWRKLRNRGFHEATQLHSNLSQDAREEALADFKSGKYRVLIATDVMGRGIHVDDVAHVINYDFPRDAEDYVHRIGRTGRAESTGISTSIITPRDYPCVKDVEKLTGKKILGDRANDRPAPSYGHKSGPKRR